MWDRSVSFDDDVRPFISLGELDDVGGVCPRVIAVVDLKQGWANSLCQKKFLAK